MDSSSPFECSGRALADWAVIEGSGAARDFGDGGAADGAGFALVDVEGFAAWGFGGGALDGDDAVGFDAFPQ